MSVDATESPAKLPAAAVNLPNSRAHATVVFIRNDDLL